MLPAYNGMHLNNNNKIIVETYEEGDGYQADSEVSAKESKALNSRGQHRQKNFPKFLPFFFWTFTIPNSKTLFQCFNDTMYNHFHWAKKNNNNKL